MEPVENIEKSSGSKRFPKRSNRYSPEFKLQVVKKLIEESVPVSVIQQECGVSGESIGRWVRDYRRYGEAGLSPHRNGKGRSLPGPVRQKIIDLKKSNPLFGIKRISQVLRRVFFLSASPETVRKTLRDSSLGSSPPKKRQRNITRPRFFERSTPNQLWQTDIFTFRLGGHYAYLIGYIDDYSRYVTGLELFRSQTGQNVIEVYRRAASEYNPPKEMLTDNGRQYTSWRGNSRFEGEMKKDKIHHIKSRPHHPMTLGKIERFWKTIYLEFLSRAQFESFEDAAERIRQWLKYYNHKRPHQGIGGLCPADRYFEIQSELKKTIEQGIQENILEMALRGKPKLPFYIVGRMEGQSVVLRAEKGRLRLSVDDDDDVTQEVVYNLEDKGDTHGQGQSRAEENPAELRSNGEVPGGAVDLDGAEKALGGLPGALGAVDGAGPVAEAGHGGDAPGTGAPGEPGQGAGSLAPAPDDAGEEAPVAPGQQQAGKDPGKSPGSKESGPLAVKGPEAVKRIPQDGEVLA
jgi:transposase InsO family protein